MAYCANCGKEISNQAPACPQCGHPQAGVPPVWSPTPARRTEGLAVASLICGVGSFIIFPVIPAIVAIVLGTRAKQRLRENPQLEGEGMAKAGIIVGWANIGLWVLIIAVIVIVAANGGFQVE
ncbi:MAG: DUF4190 domain-containing protein [Actinomycetota bacterium]|nr:DUF4190 domain-containing protein [Actinomycetota bacterium]